MRLHLPLLLLALPAVSGAAGTFSTSPLTGDADSGISSNNAYTHAFDMGDPGNRTINGAVFTGAGPGGTNNFSTTGLTGTLNNWPVVNPPGPAVTGATGGLFTNFNYNAAGAAETLTLNNLRVGQQYETVFYNAAWGGPRSQNVTTSDGGAITFDQDAAPGSLLKYSFTATGTSQTFTFTPNQPASFHQYAFTNQAVGWKSLLTDNFYAPSNPNTADLNFNLAARQGGSLVTTSGVKTWVPRGNTQVGNPTGGMDGGNYLLNAFFDGVAALDHNFNGSSSAGGLSVSFDMAPNSTGNSDTTNWQAVNIGQDSASKNDVVNGPGPHLGILFRGNGLMEVWDGSNLITSAPSYSGTSHTNDFTHIEMLFSDPTDLNPFDGVGQTTVDVYANGSLVYNFTKSGGGYANNYINFSNSFIGGVDNLNIAQRIPEPGTALLGALAALGLMRRRR